MTVYGCAVDLLGTVVSSINDFEFAISVVSGA